MKRNLNDIKDAKQLMNLSLYAGKLLVKNGAEIYRAEDTVQRICKSVSNVEAVDAYVLTSGIFVSLEYDNEIITIFKKVHNSTINLEKIDKINDFSRRFVNEDISYNQGMQILKDIDENSNLDNWKAHIAAGWLASFFSLLFGGDLKDFLCAFIITLFMSFILSKASKFKFNFFIYNFLGAFVSSIFALVLTNLNFASNYNMVIIGSIMILVPGVSATNAARDIINGDFLSGVMGLAKTVFLGLAIALGVGAALQIFK